MKDIRCKELLHNIMYVVAVLAMLMPAVLVSAQTGLYVPSQRPIRNMQKALTNPEVFLLLIQYGEGESEYDDSDLDMLDSAYRIAFDVENPRLYTMTIESYGTTDETVARERADAVYRYFAMRSHARFPIRYARNPIHCTCFGDTSEVLRFEVPTNTVVYQAGELPPDRLLLNKSIPLENTVLVTFSDNPDECVGAARGCYVPAEDSTVYGYYAWMQMNKGAIRTIDNTKDTCRGGVEIRLEDHLNYKELLEHYHLVPHRRQVIAMAGYVVVKATLPLDADSCVLQQRDSIYIRIPVTQEQVDAKLRFFAKVRTSKGVEYKAMPTRKVPGKGPLALQSPINITMFDTIYIGKRLQEKEIDKYFYKVDSSAEVAAFKVGDKYYTASRPDRNGEPQMKKALKALFRTVVEQEEDGMPNKSLTPAGEEIIE